MQALAGKIKLFHELDIRWPAVETVPIKDMHNGVIQGSRVNHCSPLTIKRKILVLGMLIAKPYWQTLGMPMNSVSTKLGKHTSKQPMIG